VAQRYVHILMYAVANLMPITSGDNTVIDGGTPGLIQ